MTSADEARLHLAKSREFLEAAETSRDLGLDNAATSDATGAKLATTLSRLLNLKTRSQYASRSVSATDANRAVEWATRMFVAAETVVRDR